VAYCALYQPSAPFPSPIAPAPPPEPRSSRELPSQRIVSLNQCTHGHAARTSSRLISSRVLTPPYRCGAERRTTARCCGLRGHLAGPAEPTRHHRRLRVRGGHVRPPVCDRRIPPPVRSSSWRIGGFFVRLAACSRQPQGRGRLYRPLEAPRLCLRLVAFPRDAGGFLRGFTTAFLTVRFRRAFNCLVRRGRLRNSLRQ
jgi:hypothetical protein